MIQTVKNYIYGNNGSFPINTIIGGVASTIPTKSALATKLNVPEYRIRRFEIVGSDVHANINGNYNLGVPGGSTGTGTFYTDNSITSFLDLNGLVKTLAASSCFNASTVQKVYLPNLQKLNGYDFYNASKLTELYLPNVTETYSNRQFYNTRVPILNLPSLVSVEDQQVTFRQMTATTEINMKKLKALGFASSHDDCFTMLKLGCIIRVNVFMATSNSGAPHAALLWAKTNRAAIVEFYDDNGNYVSTL